jgi:hypothetical protein
MPARIYIAHFDRVTLGLDGYAHHFMIGSQQDRLGSEPCFLSNGYPHWNSTPLPV